MILVYINLGGIWLPYQAHNLSHAQRLARPYADVQIWRGLLRIR